MINKLLRSFSINKNIDSLTKEQESVIIHDIEIINYKRMRLFLSILLVVEILFIIFSDLPSLRNGNIDWIWGDRRYLILHILLSLLSLAGIIFISFLFKKYKDNTRKINKTIIPILTILILVLVSIIDGLDQIKTGHASSVFIANILICSALLIIKFPTNLFVYTVPFTTFVLGLFIFQNDAGLLYSNLTNGLIFFVAVIVISKVMYDNQYAQMSKNIILKEINEKLAFISKHDPLTGLSNRRNFEVEAINTLKTANDLEQESALILIDIDHFKYVNDNFGHPVGDMVLKEVSDILIGHLRDTDLAVRWGGEEFLLLISPTTMDEAYQLSNKIREAIEKKSMIFDKNNISITASFGVASLTGSFSNSFSASYKSADAALYKAKQSGRNQVVLGS